VQFLDSSFSSTGTITGWQWDLDGDAIVDSTAQNPVFNYAAAGSYSVSLTVADSTFGAASSTRSGYVVVLAPDATEIEPNETKAQALANGVITMSPGTMILGTTTGGIANPGPTSADWFLVRTAPLPPGIYRHRLVPDSPLLAHTLSIMSLNVVTPLSIVVAQSSIQASTPPRRLEWYGFGRSEMLYVRVVGTTATTLPYVLTLETQALTAVNIPGSFPAGLITLSSLGNATNLEVHVFDSAFQELLDYQNDNWSGVAGSIFFSLQRTYANGTYYVAVGRSNLTSEFPSASTIANNPLHYYPGSLGGERIPSPLRMDFPGSIVGSSTLATVASSTFTVTADGQLPTTVPGSIAAPHEILWYRMTVGPGGCEVPVITAGPTSLEICFGNTATLSVTATGTEPLVYQWQFNGSPIAIGTGPTLTLPNVDFSFTGLYSCQVSNACGNATSVPVMVHVHPAGPEITDDPDPQTLCPGATATFTVTAVARMQGALEYQWFKDGLPIPSATTSTLSFVVGSVADGGQYFCRVTEFGCGAADSSAALLTVRNAAPVITLLGNAVVNLECGVDTYVEAGATVSDDCDVGLVATIGGDTVHAHTEGHYVITYSVMDSQGNHAAQVQRHVFVADTIRPTVLATVATGVMWSPNHGLVNVGLTVQTYDACGPTAAAANVVVRVFCDETELPDTGDGTGHHAPDAKEVAAGTLRLRSERRGSGDGRVYVIMVSTEDDAGNTGFAFATVVVPAAQNQTALAVAQLQAADVAAQLTALAATSQQVDDLTSLLTSIGLTEHGLTPVTGPIQ
jgi:PKD repeat protein